MLNAIIGSKINQTQTFDKKGNRIPVTNILTGPCRIVGIKQKDKDGYDAVILGLGNRRPKTISKALLGQLQKSGMDKNPPRFLKEVKLEDIDSVGESVKPGNKITASEVFKAGDRVWVTGTSKGLGFAGVVKRHHFKGGPRTHGQSDRERAPGSIGQTTTPGRVYKGKRMAGRMGNDRVTVKNLEIINVDPDKDILTVKGLVAGKRNSLLIIRKIFKEK